MKIIIILFLSIGYFKFAYADSITEDYLHKRGIEVQSEEKNTFGYLRIGLSQPKVSLQNQKIYPVFYNITIGAQKSLNKDFGVFVEIGKYLTSNEELSNSSSSYANNHSLGGVFAITGNLKDIKRIYTKRSPSSKKNLISSTKRKLTKNNSFDGFRIKAYLSEYVLGAIVRDSLLGGGGALYYEQRLYDNYLKYGVKGDFVQNNEVSLNVFELFAEFSF